MVDDKADDEDDDDDDDDEADALWSRSFPFPCPERRVGVPLSGSLLCIVYLPGGTLPETLSGTLLGTLTGMPGIPCIASGTKG